MNYVQNTMQHPKNTHFWIIQAVHLQKLTRQRAKKGRRFVAPFQKSAPQKREPGQKWPLWTVLSITWLSLKNEQKGRELLAGHDEKFPHKWAKSLSRFRSAPASNNLHPINERILYMLRVCWVGWVYWFSYSSLFYLLFPLFFPGFMGKWGYIFQIY